MCLLNENSISYLHEKNIKQHAGESTLHYKMFKNYSMYRNIPELVRAYNISTKELFEIKQKNNWNDRIAKYESNKAKVYIKEHFTEIYNLNDFRRDNLMRLAKSTQHQIYNFQEYISGDPKELKSMGKPTEIEMVNVVRQTTRAMLDMHKLVKIIHEELKVFGIDLTPEFINKFEQEEILGDNLLDYADDTEDIIRLNRNEPYDYSQNIQLEDEKTPSEKESNDNPKSTTQVSVIEQQASVVEPIEKPETPIITERPTPASVIERIEMPENTERPTQVSVVERVETPETQATEPNPLNQIQNFINQTKNKLKELGVDSNSSVVERVETHDEEEEYDDDYYEDDDEEEYYDEFAPENHRYPFPMEYLIPITER